LHKQYDIKMKRKKFTKEYHLKGESSSSENVGFTLRMTESRADIETKAKDWKVTFRRDTYEYNYLLYMIKEDSVRTVYELAVAIFLTRWLFRDAEMIVDMYKQERLLQKSQTK